MRIKIVVYDALPDDSKMIREEVFVKEQGFNEEFDSVDAYAFHLVAYDDFDTPIGTCRIFANDSSGRFYLGRLAVVKEHRGKDIGSDLVSRAEKLVCDKGGLSIHLHSQQRAMEFYLKCGYEAYGEIELEEGCPHIWMHKKLHKEVL